MEDFTREGKATIVPRYICIDCGSYYDYADIRKLKWVCSICCCQNFIRERG